VPRARAAYELPTPLDSPASAAPEVEPEYPSAVHLVDNRWLLADGRGTILVLDIPSDGSAVLVATHDLGPDAPFSLHAATISNGGATVALVSTAVRLRREPGAERSASSVEFHVRVLELPHALGEPPCVLWEGAGAGAPTFASYDPARGAFLVLGESPYSASAPEADPAPAADELAPIPRAGETLDAPPLYAWTQTGDGVSVTFTQPRALRASAFTVEIRADAIALTVSGTVVLPRTALWDGCMPDESTWTWDAPAGALTLELAKAHADTRWPQLFASGANAPDVPEALDPSARAAIAEALEKHTADAADAAARGPVPSLARGEADDDVDADVAEHAWLTWAPARAGAHTDADRTPVPLLATPLPGFAAPDAPATLVAKRGLDGLLFALAPGADGGADRWAHAGTFPALAFVLASKRETRFVLHAGAHAAFALEAGAGNAFVFRAPGRALYGQQMIVRVGPGLLGACALRAADGAAAAVLCLCERELVLLRGLIPE
jgi:hypothetical protein